jgi:hypothetical protein
LPQVSGCELSFHHSLLLVGGSAVLIGRATRQMSTYTPDEATTSVAPLLQFFELVHVGDTIQSMMQVYFDKDLAKYVDKTDFLNGVMREKKRFESVLDDAVAAGLNAGIEVLMNQVSCPRPLGYPLTLGGTYYPSQNWSSGVLPCRRYSDGAGAY